MPSNSYPSLKEVLISNFNRYTFHLIYLMWKAYRNPFKVLINSVTNRYPFTAELKNGQKVTLTREGVYAPREVAFLYLAKARGKDIDIEQIDETTVKITYNGRKILFQNYRQGDIFGVFVNEEYGLVDVKDRTVIDCGAAIGDSTIYFAIKGARRVLGFELDPQISKVAEDNLRLNGVNSAYILNAGCGKDGTYMLNNDTIQIPIFSLRTIVERFQVEDGSILKIDCEGCEYEFLLNESNETLSRFSQIIMEYHHGYEALKKKLEKAGFRVKATTPMLVRHPTGNQILGRLYAYRD